MSTDVNFFKPNDEQYLGVSITPNAAKYILSLIAQDPLLLGLRLGVRKSGCAGFAYDLSLVKEKLIDDLVFEKKGGKLFVSTDMIKYVDGTTVDYVTIGLNSMFTYSNPKASQTCGCGESFNV
ncbi:FeS assembly scaffold SufA [Psychromonas sp. CNPT3]|uniref:iron-sulfur cluster assembly accessory protein n=1 Tax=Psychromonas sp. CNPT3 TaxID=314282 RepID=UPI00006E8AA0|nr:iron-sulfur cluster assembly accessory protein [Psychromonas sp. CNPT3]AGH80492.1 FeS assembly scaffold SufA [Psychromonas sp. CNPT3]